MLWLRLRHSGVGRAGPLHSEVRWAQRLGVLFGRRGGPPVERVGERSDLHMGCWAGRQVPGAGQPKQLCTGKLAGWLMAGDASEKPMRLSLLALATVMAQCIWHCHIYNQIFNL